MADNSKPSIFKRLASGSPSGSGASKPPPKKQNVDSSQENAVKEENEEVLSGNLSIEVLENVASQHADNTYAGAASKPKVDLKNLVYVQKGR